MWHRHLCYYHKRYEITPFILDEPLALDWDRWLECS
jgi:hypothetical protein